MPTGNPATQAQPYYGYGYTPPAPVSSYVAMAGEPAYPTFQPGYNPYTEATAPGVSQALGGIGTDTSGLSDFESQAERTGPSTWANLADQQQDAQAQQQRGQAMQQSGAQGAATESNLAMTGGLTSGARERVNRDAGRNSLGAQQTVNQNEGLNKLQIGVNDEQNRIQELGQLPGMENAQAQVGLQKEQLQQSANQFDIGAQANEAQSQNDYSLGTYHEQMQALAASNQAQATLNSGKKS